MAKFLRKFFFYLVFVTGSLIFAQRSAAQNPSKKPQDKLIEKTNSPKKGNTMFWGAICEIPDFALLFDCNKSDICYQVELLNDPFKDFIAITMIFKDSIVDTVYYSLFKFKNEKINYGSKKNKLNKAFPIINPYSKDTLYCYYGSPKRISIRGKNGDISRFFTKILWSMPSQSDGPIELDGETWSIKGRNGNSEAFWVRRSFTDSIYYKNIQKLLDICKVKDYKYTKK